MSVDIARDLAGVHPLAAVSSNSSHPGTRWQIPAKWHQYTSRSENLDEDTALRVNWSKNTKLQFYPGFTKIRFALFILFQIFTDQMADSNDLEKIHGTT